MGVEKDPEERGAGEAGGRGSRPRQTKADVAAPSGVAGPAGCGGSPWSLGPAESGLRPRGKPTSAELISLVHPPQLAFVVLWFWQRRSDEDECVILHVSWLGYNGANRILLCIF